MRMLHTEPELKFLEGRVIDLAKGFGMTLPEIRFYILDSLEFASLLEKRVYPVSPVNIWEGKRMVGKKYRIESGQESSLYYEVVQTGDPSYAYLNNTNNAMVQATVMAHVCGHCEFSELNVLQDSTRDRSEYVMWLVKNVNQARQQMGQRSFGTFWNAAESALPLLSPNSRYSLARSIETERAFEREIKQRVEQKVESSPLFTPSSYTLDSLLKSPVLETAYEVELKSKLRQETLNRKGYRLKAPCQDVFGFLKNFAPSTKAELSVLDYLYTIHFTGDFVIKTQIMNEGWAMYWEKKIMLELFKERSCKGIIDYAKIFSGVCYPRPYYQRNPYHLGFYMWCHIEELLRDGKISLDFEEEISVDAKDSWKRGGTDDPIAKMRHLVSSVTDYEFLRRFLTPELIHKFHLNRVPQRDFVRLGISKRDVIQENKYYVWLRPDGIKGDMLRFFTHYYRPRIYLIDTDFEDGCLLLYHRDDGRRLRTNWIQPTLKNISHIWKAGVSLISRNTLFGYHAGRYSETSIRELGFDVVQERIQDGKKPLVLN